jgi:hypothetical protein
MDGLPNWAVSIIALAVGLSPGTLDGADLTGLRAPPLNVPPGDPAQPGDLTLQEDVHAARPEFGTLPYYPSPAF